MENFEQQLTKLLDEGKIAEAKKLIEDFLAQPLDEKQKGEIAFNKAMVYIRAKNEINKEYIQKAREILGQLDELDKQEHGANNDQAIGDIRKKIQEM